ncbi:MAG: glycosyltransferase [Lentisphaeria bacterium]|nr:glycosyltransferase [Lentisphaeria bacterium]
MIKILQVVPKLSRDGISTFLLNYLQTICNEETVFDFICMKIDDSTIVNTVEKHGGKVFAVPLLSVGKLVKNLCFIISFFYKKRKEYDIIHVHQIGTGFIYLFIAWIFRIPRRIAHSHSTMYSAIKKKAFVNKIFTKVFLNYATDYWGCSEVAGKFMFGEKKWNKQGVLIKNAVPISQYAYSENNRVALREELNLSSECKIFLFAGYLNVGKNPFFAFDVFSKIISEEPDAKLLICGTNYMGEKIFTYLRNKGIQDNVLLLGARSDIERFYSAADILLFPSLAEGLPFTVIEAQVSGLPCLISDRITEEVVILDTTIRYPLEKGAAAWANQAKQMLNKCRETGEKQIKLSGYDIVTAGKRLQNLYSLKN